MVMFNLYFRNCLPFVDVFIHAMIQDGEGQKMSKSLGNGVDPLDIIHSHGADAMRYTLAVMTTQTQDVKMPVDTVCPYTGEMFAPKTIRTKAGHVVAAPTQKCPSDSSKEMVTSYGVASGTAKPSEDMPQARNSSPKFDSGRNFANKIWNAGRFTLGRLEGHDDGGKPVEITTLADRWILSRLVQTIQNCDRSLATFQFNHYAQGLYDFFWRDFCDWYVESSKTVASGNDAAGVAARAVLTACLDASMRLMHPVMPYVSEKLWEKLNEIRTDRGIAGLDLPASDMCMTAAWPTAADSLIDADADVQFGFVQEAVSGLRQVRTQYQVKPRQSVTIRAKAGGAALDKLTATQMVIGDLAVAEFVEIGPDVSAGSGAATAIIGEIECYIEGLIDPKAERERLSKRKDELLKLKGNLQGRLGNANYVDKAPAHLVQQTRDQLADTEAELATIEQTLLGLSG
jgi:valyl-tRNA synthetase